MGQQLKVEAMDGGLDWGNMTDVRVNAVGQKQFEKRINARIHHGQLKVHRGACCNRLKWPYVELFSISRAKRMNDEQGATL